MALHAANNLLHSGSIVISTLMFVIGLLLIAVVFLFVDNRRIYTLETKTLRTLISLRMAINAQNGIPDTGDEDSV